MSTTTHIDTRRVADRRALHFKDLDEVLADVHQLVAAERAGKLHCLGNWSLGQNLGHLATWVNYSFDGVPLKVPWIFRVAMKAFMKKRALYQPMPAGRNIPRVRGGTLAIDPMPTDEGVAKIEHAFARLKAGPPALPHLLFGKLNHEEWINQHLRHAELHLSFCRSQ